MWFPCSETNYRPLKQSPQRMYCRLVLLVWWHVPPCNKTAITINGASQQSRSPRARGSTVSPPLSCAHRRLGVSSLRWLPHKYLICIHNLLSFCGSDLGIVRPQKVFLLLFVQLSGYTPACSFAFSTQRYLTESRFCFQITLSCHSRNFTPSLQDGPGIWKQ